MPCARDSVFTRASFAARNLLSVRGGAHAFSTKQETYSKETHSPNTKLDSERQSCGENMAK